MKQIVALMITLSLATSCQSVLADSEQVRPDYYVCDGIDFVEGENGYLFRSVDFWGKYEIDPRALMLLDKLTSYLSEHGTQLIMLDVPRRGFVYRGEELREVPYIGSFDREAVVKSYHDAAEAYHSIGVETVDLLSPLANVNTASATPFFKRDHHWTPDFMLQVAESLSAHIKASDAYDAFPKRQYQLALTAQRERFGSLSKKVEASCDIRLPTETYADYTLIDVSESPLGLFDDTNPSVVIVGTSMSTSFDRWDLGMMLAAELNAEVYNTSYAAAGEFGALYDYLIEDRLLSEHDPSFLIWERSIKWNLDDESIAGLRQILSGLNPTCAEGDFLFEDRVELGEEIVLPEAVKRVLRDKGAIISFEAPYPLTGINMELVDNSGATAEVALGYFGNLFKTSQFFWNIKPNKDIASIITKGDIDIEGEISLRICTSE